MDTLRNRRNKTQTARTRGNGAFTRCRCRPPQAVLPDDLTPLRSAVKQGRRQEPCTIYPKSPTYPLSPLTTPLHLPPSSFGKAIKSANSKTPKGRSGLPDATNFAFARPIPPEKKSPRGNFGSRRRVGV
jgi:hypothetical protein